MSPVSLDHLILTIRGEKVILDTELARLYGVTPKRLNEQVKRNADRFPEDFVFRLTKDEFDFLKANLLQLGAQPIVSKELGEVVAKCDHLERLKFSRNLPWAFTEHGAVMAAGVLNSPEAVSMSVFVVRAFVLSFYTSFSYFSVSGPNNFQTRAKSRTRCKPIHVVWGPGISVRNASGGMPYFNKCTQSTQYQCRLV